MIREDWKWLEPLDQLDLVNDIDAVLDELVRINMHLQSENLATIIANLEEFSKLLYLDANKRNF